MPDLLLPAPTPADVVDAVLAETDLGLHPPLVATRVGGGYSWRTHVVRDGVGRHVVVRVAPPGGTMAPYDPGREARAVRAAQGVVACPEPLATVSWSERLGAGFGVQRFLPGAVARLSDVDPVDRGRVRAAAATALGRIHAGGAPDVLDPEAAAGTTSHALRLDLEATLAAFRHAGAPRHPGVVVGLRWALTHLPRVPDPPVLCHGDFRLHNLVLHGDDAPGVLDWERAWVGDPMVDVAFTRRFSGWCAVDGDAVPAYEAAAGRPVDEDRVAWGDRYELVRSLSSGARGWRALADGRDDTLELFAIGEAGQAGAWALVELLAAGPLLPCPPDGLDPAWRAVLGEDRRRTLGRAAAEVGQAELGTHLVGDPEADARATAASVAALRALDPPAGVVASLRAGLDHRDPQVAWARAHEVLATAVTTGGADLLPSLRALGRRHTDRATLLPPLTLARHRP